MILDTSAIVAIALKELGYETLLRKLAGARPAGVGLPTLTETAIVLSARLKQDARGILSRFLMEGSISTVPFEDAHFPVAVDAWLRYAGDATRPHCTLGIVCRMPRQGWRESLCSALAITLAKPICLSLEVRNRSLSPIPRIADGGPSKAMCGNSRTWSSGRSCSRTTSSFGLIHAASPSPPPTFPREANREANFKRSRGRWCTQQDLTPSARAVGRRTRSRGRLQSYLTFGF